MARALDSIIQELDASYNPSRQLINSKLDALPGQADAEISGLKAQEQDYYDNTIMGAAREKGVGFGGISLGERAKYGAGTFMPAVARVRSSQNEVKSGLLEALNNTNLDQRKTGMSIYQAEQDRDERRAAEERQAAAQRAASAASAPFDFSSLLGPAPAEQTRTAGNVAGAKVAPRADGGHNFIGTNGAAISAAQYAQAKGIPFRQLLQTLATNGDKGAKAALGFVGDDFGYDPRKITSKAQADLYNSLVWGTNRSANFAAPKASTSPVSKSLTIPTLMNVGRR